MSRVATVHYPEGQGHATRMLGVARALERRGAEVVIAGGGPGTRFVELNGYDVYRATPVDFIRDYQYRSPALAYLLARSTPMSVKRTVDVARWLRRESPDVLVTDDMFAVAAATVTRTPFYIVSHNAASLYDAVLDRFITRGINRSQQLLGEEFLYPAVWPPTDGDPQRIRRIPPIAHEPGASSGARPDVDVLLVPSSFSKGFADLAEMVRADGRGATLVGGEAWSPVPSLVPWIRAANVVVSSGYSTVMEAAIAGTPCIIHPCTDEQHGVARKIERAGVEGFRVEHSFAHATQAVGSPPPAPTHENGVDRVAEAVLGRRE